MNCDQIQRQLNALLDGELADGERAAVEAHLGECSDCRTVAEELSGVVDRCQQYALSEKRRADWIAEEVIAGLEVLPQTARPAVRWTTSLRSIVFLLASAAAGFVAALVIFPPERSPEIVEFRPLNRPETNLQAVPVATLKLAIGDVKVLREGEEAVTVISPLQTFSCPSDSIVETSEGAACELKTTNGSVVRLDNGTRLILRRADEVVLDRGRIQCEAPLGTELRVVASGQNSDSENQSPVLNCKSNACMWSVKSDDRWQVASATGEVEVVSPAQRKTLGPGESAEIVAGELQPVSYSDDPLLDTQWIHQLLVRQGPDNPELQRRVDRMLARIGISKVSQLYEAEIRSLGEHAVLPLIRFLNSPLSNEDVQRRRVASRIVSDLATTSTIGDLIPLLEHDDPQVRVDAAAALERLTRITHGRKPDEWIAPPSENAEFLEQWKTWWEQNRARYPSPG